MEGDASAHLMNITTLNDSASQMFQAPNKCPGAPAVRSFEVDGKYRAASRSYWFANLFSVIHKACKGLVNIPSVPVHSTHT